MQKGHDLCFAETAKELAQPVRVTVWWHFAVFQPDVHVEGIDPVSEPGPIDERHRLGQLVGQINHRYPQVVVRLRGQDREPALAGADIH